jgi:Glycosyl transferase family 2
MGTNIYIKWQNMKRLNIGLLLSFNEADVLPQMLAAHESEIDVIYALDGSTDETTNILRQHPLIDKILLDKDVAQNAPVRDFHRQALLEVARQRHGYGHWYTLLHADEFFHDSPRAVIRAAEETGAGMVNWMSMQFFLHLSDTHLYNEAGIPIDQDIQKRITWYSPFWIEVRQFLDVQQFFWQKVAYKQGQHARVHPHGHRLKPFWKMPILKHYTYRSPAQILGKNLQPGLSASTLQQAVFRTTAQDIYKYGIQLKNPLQPDFGRLELAHQKSLLHTFLLQKSYLQRRTG